MRGPRYEKSPDQADESTKKDVLRIPDNPITRISLTVFLQAYFYEIIYRKVEQAEEPKSPNT